MLLTILLAKPSMPLTIEFANCAPGSVGIDIDGAFMPVGAILAAGRAYAG